MNREVRVEEHLAKAEIGPTESRGQVAVQRPSGGEDGRSHTSRHVGVGGDLRAERRRHARLDGPRRPLPEEGPGNEAEDGRQGRRRVLRDLDIRETGAYKVLGKPENRSLSCLGPERRDAEVPKDHRVTSLAVPDLKVRPPAGTLCVRDW